MEIIIFKIKQGIIFLIRAFYSFLNGEEKCAVCGRKSFILPVCKKCRNDFFSVDKLVLENRCKICGKPLISTKIECLQCRESPVLKHTDRVLPLYAYNLWNKEILFLWKINEIRCLSPFFAQQVSLVLHQLGQKVIIPVPPRPGKIKQKGWDQIDELCRFLKNRYSFEVLEILERRTKQEQKKLDRAERLEQISSAYVLKSPEKLEKILKKYKSQIPEEVCIIDDVCTTGATVEQCAAILKGRGVKIVNAITLFAV